MSDTETTETTSDSAQPVKAVTSLIPRDEARCIDTSRVVQHFGWRISNMRHTQSTRETLAVEFEKFKLAVSPLHTHLTPQQVDELDLANIFEQIEQHIRADQRYDSETNQAHRALSTVLTQTYGDKMLVTGWVPGEVVKVKPWITERSPERYFELTGRQCPKCEVNPERYGDHGSGVACINEAECGWWYCA